MLAVAHDLQVGNVTLQHATLDFSLADMAAHPILTSTADIGRELLLESATSGTVSSSRQKVYGLRP